MLAEAAGYAHPDYAQALSEFGEPLLLPASQGWILVRSIPDGSTAQIGCTDAMGTYPLFACQDWRALPEDLEKISHSLVSLALVADPFGNYTLDLLRTCFGDILYPFKQHYIVDAHLPPGSSVSAHHRSYARSTLRKVSVWVHPEPTQFVDEWVRLYACLVERHGLRGIKAFSRRAFSAMLELPGLVLLVAQSGDEPLAAHMWFVQGEVAYSHLAASSEEGYKCMASYALHWQALVHFHKQVRWLDLGAGAGVGAGADVSGLEKFKRGWASDSRPVYFCGRIFNSQRYAEISALRGEAQSGYFPAYRRGEMA